MFHTKSILAAIMLFVLMACAQQVSSQLSLKAVEQNLFRSPRQSCSCIACTCGGGTCPQSVAAHAYTSFSLTCPTGQVVSSYSVNVQSTDGSSFKYYTVSEADFEKYKQGLPFSYYNGPSSASSVTCVYAGTYRLDQQNAKFFVECTNAIMSCPLKYSVSYGCTTPTGTVVGLDLSAPTTVNSGQTFTTTVRLLDTSGNTVSTSGESISLSWEGSGTLGGSTTATTSNGVATFSNSITVSSSVSAKLKATYTTGGNTYSQSRGVDVQTGSNPVDYTSAWVGTWKVQDTCDVNSCCCLTGSVSVTKSNTNTVFLTGPVNGQCGSSTSMSAQVSNINSDTTLSAIIFNNPFILTRNGNELTVVNQKATQCSGRAVKTSGSSNIKQASFLIVCLLVLISFLF
ncbi:predicted protein [Naegleria gruberi]|uniref:Predicted protein n=1 Tax=Naegleria gruberi TaxID=5762 RepID=D2VV27_NAEGR|nr:uncharacterized protein NAEGRDRAFT_72869 [Naegleria gruberi]EFC39422.1 predicted protein [Naegleria gruberi]|eukprot:XP_002672166.1 predicted protein [Naegleria gruberi strain NEG-M]